MNAVEVKTLFYLTLSGVKSRYRNTFAGFAWVLLSPIILYLVNGIIFKYILKVEVEDFFLFLLSGMIPWYYISGSLLMTCPSILTQREMILSFNLSPIQVALTRVLDNTFNFIITLFLLVSISTIIYDLELVTFVRIIPPITLLVLFSSSLSLFVAMIFIYFRDIEYLLKYLLSALIYLTPILYPKSYIPEKFIWVSDYNLFYYFISLLQTAIWKYDQTIYTNNLITTSCITFVTVMLTMITWKISRNGIYARI